MQSYFSYLRYHKLISGNRTVAKNRMYLGSSALDPVLCDTTDAVNTLKAGLLLHNLISTQNKAECYRAYKNSNRIFEKTSACSFFWLLVGGLRHSISLMYHGQSHLWVMLLWCMVQPFFITPRVERFCDNESSRKLKEAVCWLSCCQPAEIFFLTELWQVLTAFAESSKEISNVNVSSSINSVWAI